ncbi:MAG TPA: sugar-binding domain-containing protein [Solirubrobacteraceae bacterium]|nr:sugar-binding domain-containing protein [Solirubrobacteraceae bacterium]
MQAAARLYYLQDATQAAIAKELGVSRPTVSRLLAEARREGIVRIEVLEPGDSAGQALGGELADALGVDAVHLMAAPNSGAALAVELGKALASADLGRGDALVVSSGRSIYEAARQPLPELPGVLLAPMMGGVDEPEAWYATNELTRQIAERVGGIPVLLFAPALPGPQLRERLLEDPGVRRVLELWRTARCAVIGVGAPLMARTTLPQYVIERAGALRDAVGDICGRFYDAEGNAIAFDGAERLIATNFDELRAIPTTIALAAGVEKASSIAVAARAGLLTQLITDSRTAHAILDWLA